MTEEMRKYCEKACETVQKIFDENTANEAMKKMWKKCDECPDDPMKKR